ncbi:MAG: hypothetical protein U0Z17_01795 [Bacteroidales bacterium]
MAGTNPDNRVRAFANIKGISGALIEASCSERHSEFTYSEDFVSYCVILDKAPASTYIDGIKKNVTVYAEPNSDSPPKAAIEEPII